MEANITVQYGALVELLLELLRALMAGHACREFGAWVPMISTDDESIQSCIFEGYDVHHIIYK